MKRYDGNFEKYYEIPEKFEKYTEGYAEELDEEWRHELEKSEVEWVRDIEEIENSDIRKTEMEAARDIIKMKEDLDDRLSSGEILKEDYEKEYEEKLMGEKRRAITRSFIEKEGISAEDLGGIFEGWDDPHRPLSQRDLTASKLEKAIEAIGPDGVEKINDRMFVEGNISKETHEKVSEKVQNSREKEGIEQENNDGGDKDD